MNRLYLDYNATAPLRPEAREAMLAALGEVGNASSVHAEGRAARRASSTPAARWRGSSAAKRSSSTFTSGGTEANNTVLTPDWRIGSEIVDLGTLLVGATEHPSVLAGGGFAADEIRTIPVDGEGIVDRDALPRHAGQSRRPGAGVGDARQQRDRRHPAGRRSRRHRP